ncbi:PREDICTED: uncharacterized protein LOC105533785 [Mandrillus leucophaeus]|uniref:uncharacterized protein LOC105533785 n=1 Tax=Mandrillus leucophaeus TaxID=9568 RepID=UPI0005F51E6C|nr:PREDICTED: uncharacterized protein LOC105533785 [Mandrillus leucophaeus]
MSRKKLVIIFPEKPVPPLSPSLVSSKIPLPTTTSPPNMQKTALWEFRYKQACACAGDTDVCPAARHSGAEPVAKGHVSVRVRFLLRAAQVPEAERTRRAPWPREGPRVKPGLELALAVATEGAAARRCLYGRWRTGARRGAALSSGVLFPRAPWRRRAGLGRRSHVVRATAGLLADKSVLRRVLSGRSVVTSAVSGRLEPAVECQTSTTPASWFRTGGQRGLGCGFTQLLCGAAVLSSTSLLCWAAYLAATGVHLPNLQQTTFRSFLISWCSGHSWIRDISKLLSPSSPPPPGPNSCPSHPSPCSPCPPRTPLEWVFIKPKSKKPTDLAVTTTPGPGS